MSTMTNKHDLPAPVVEAIKAFNASYSKGSADFSATELLKPAWQRRLQIQHASDIVVDASDGVSSLFGSAVHAILEAAAGMPSVTVEERLFADFNGVMVSGQVDVMTAIEHGTIIDDYKTGKAYKIKGGVPDDWVEQENIYAELARRNGVEVFGLRVVFICLDWSKAEAARDSAYPQAPITVHQVELLSPVAATGLIERRIAAQSTSTPEPCTAEERWQTEDTWAVQKPANKRASKVCTSMDEAEDWVIEQKRPSDYAIIERPGTSRRCQDWCSVSEFCSYWQEIKPKEEDK